MWVVAKIKKKEISFFKNELKEKIGKDIKFYNPQIELEKFIKNKMIKYKKPLLEDYIFCYHKNFENKKNINCLSFIKGLKFFLKGHDLNQVEILGFINYCKSFENKEGNIKAMFFKSLLSKKAKFIRVPKFSEVPYPTIMEPNLVVEYYSR